MLSAMCTGRHIIIRTANSGIQTNHFVYKVIITKLYSLGGHSFILLCRTSCLCYSASGSWHYCFTFLRSCFCSSVQKISCLGVPIVLPRHSKQITVYYFKVDHNFFLTHSFHSFYHCHALMSCFTLCV
jgi:hypothetical protein